MLSRIILVATIFLVSTTFPSAAKAIWDGNKLVELANADDRNPAGYQSGIFIGFVIGVYDASRELGLFCTPSGVTNGQILEIVKKDLRDHPQYWHLPAWSLVLDSLIDQYPCKKKSQ